jgi:hypothetical protein
MQAPAVDDTGGFVKLTDASNSTLLNRNIAHTRAIVIDDGCSLQNKIETGRHGAFFLVELALRRGNKAALQP